MVHLIFSKQASRYLIKSTFSEEEIKCKDIYPHVITHANRYQYLGIGMKKRTFVDCCLRLNQPHIPKG